MEEIEDLNEIKKVVWLKWINETLKQAKILHRCFYINLKKISKEYYSDGHRGHKRNQKGGRAKMDK